MKTSTRLAVYSDGRTEEFEVPHKGERPRYMETQSACPKYEDIIGIADSIESAKKMHEEYWNPLVVDEID